MFLGISLRWGSADGLEGNIKQKQATEGTEYTDSRHFESVFSVPSVAVLSIFACAPQLSGRLTENAGSVLFPHRVMNLGKVYPYIPKKLNCTLERFAAGAQTFYDSISQLADDLSECSASMGWPADASCGS